MTHTTKFIKLFNNITTKYLITNEFSLASFLSLNNSDTNNKHIFKTKLFITFISLF